MKILLLDTETSPNQAFVWGIWQQNVAISQLIDSSQLMCFAAKWYDEDKVRFASIMTHTKKRMLKEIHKLLDEADVVVHYNGSRFDIPVLNREFISNDFLPPSPYKQVDLYKIAKFKFKFVSNKLDYIASYLGLGAKNKTDFSLWVNCMNRDPGAWKLMEAYNKQDVVLLEKLYNVFLPWITNHPNFGAYQDDKHVCPNCGGSHLQKRGFSPAALISYQRYKCMSCGTWSRSNKALPNKGEKIVHAK